MTQPVRGLPSQLKSILYRWEQIIKQICVNNKVIWIKWQIIRRIKTLHMQVYNLMDSFKSKNNVATNVTAVCLYFCYLFWTDSCH